VTVAFELPPKKGSQGLPFLWVRDARGRSPSSHERSRAESGWADLVERASKV